MTSVQLRRYEIKPGEMEAFLEAVRAAFVVREQYGFGVAFALIDEERNEFTWAVTHDGDFAAAEAEYYASPERAALPANPADHIDGDAPRHGAGRAALTVELLLAEELGQGAVQLGPRVRGEVVAGHADEGGAEALGERRAGSPAFSSSSPTTSRTGTSTPSIGAGPTAPGART